MKSRIVAYEKRDDFYTKFKLLAGFRLIILLIVLCILSGMIVNGYVKEEKYEIGKIKEKLSIYESEKRYIKHEEKIEVAEVDGNTPIITNITEIEKSFNTIKIQVESSNSDGAKFIYFYKKQGDIEYKKAGESTENTFTYEKLEEREIYELRVSLEKDGKRVEKEIKIKTDKIPVNAIKFTNLTWNNGIASVIIEVSEKSYTLQYKLRENGEWKRNIKWRKNRKYSKWYNNICKVMGWSKCNRKCNI